MAAKARERLITSAIDLMRRNGAAGTGVNELIDHAGTARRSIYNNFPGGKDELLAAATEASGKFIAKAIPEDGTPQDAIRGFVALWREMLTASDFDAGCPIAAGALAGPAAPSARDTAGDVLESWRTKLGALLERAGIAAPEAASLATMTVSAIEGGVIFAVSQRSFAPLEEVQTHLLA